MPLDKSNVKKVLFIASYRKDRAPGQRFRFEQYFNYLSEHGYNCELSYFIDEKDDILYHPGKYFQKSRIIAKAARIRLDNLFHKNDYDIIFIFREAFMMGNVFFEKQFKRSRAKLIFDFDDSIWHLDISEANKRFHWLKNPDKTGHIISLCDMVFAGNPYLAQYAYYYCSNVVVIPTTINTDEYQRVSISNGNGKVTIGWSGSVTTIKHFKLALPFLQRIKDKYGDKVAIKVIGDSNYRNDRLNIESLNWNKADEINELSSFDIGIMPLPDDEWSKGKCGLKGLQYMALNVAAVMSPVGINTEIIEHGANGFLASSEDEWFQIISQLIEDENLRKRIGTAARQTVIDRYSVNSQKENYLRYFTELLNNQKTKE